MPVSFQPSHKAQLHVEIGKTTVEELEKFQQEAQAKGGGEIRAKQNKDGSYTLYVAADRKMRMSSLFSSWGAEGRTAKRELAKDLVKEIVSRRLPHDGGGTILSRITDRNNTTQLGGVLRDVGKATYDKMPGELQEKYKQLDTIMNTPGLKKAFGESMKSQHVKENFDFLSLVQQFNKTSNPHEKLKLAEEIFKYVETPENPALVGGSGIGAGGMVQINLSESMAGTIYTEMLHLRTAIQPGMEPSEGDKARLNNLFSEAQTEIQDLTTSKLNTFTSSDAFKVEAGKAYARTVTGEHDGNPVSYLAPGSGKEHAKRVSDLSQVDNLMGDPELRSAFKQHLSGTPQSVNFDRYEQVEALALLAKDPSVSDTELLKQCEEMFLNQVPEGERDNPHYELLQSKIGELRKEHELLGGDEESRIGQEQLFGSDKPGEDNLVRDKIQGFLKDMLADAGNGLKGTRLENFSKNQLSRIVAERMFNEQLDWRPDKEQHVGSWERFAGKELVGSGGATGSGRAKVGKQLYQVKGSISHAGFGRRMKAGGLNTENYGEVIASNISRAMVGVGNRGMVPEVSLRQDSSNHEAMVTSKYLSNGKGDLKDLYKELAGPLPRGQRHPKIQLDAPPGSRTGGGVLRLSGQASRDVQRNIALSALMGDHDVNPGNMIALRDGRVGRIDFGHAFNELINAPGGTFTGGGGVRNKSNRILDFFNRETVSGNPLVRGQNKPKLWRDYTGAGPSEGMTQALRDLASSTEALDGIAQAKTQFLDLIAQLELEGTPEAKKQIEDLTKSLARIARNIEKPVTSTEPSDVARDVFNNLDAFIREGQQQMRDVADLSELQTKIDQFINQTRDNPNAPVPEDIQQAFTTLTEKSVKNPDGDGLVWMKMSSETPAFQGTLGDYIQGRRTELGGV